MSDGGSRSAYRAPSTDTQVDIQSAVIEPVPLPATPLRRGDNAPIEGQAGRYEIIEELHRGGMGEILLARLITSSGFSRDVVLKGLLTRLTEDNVSHALFMREALLMGRLEHPNIVRVFDMPTLKGRPYLAMEFVRGRNLHQVIQHSASQARDIPPLVALTIVSEALRGLHSAHRVSGDDGMSLGLVHRDVSPGNILLSFFGEVKVTDFGIAKVHDSPKYTGPRSIRGKARYVAPEQVHGRPATVASDVYSAGVVLAETLMGAPLWERGAVAETLMAIVSEDREEILDRVLRNQPPIAGLRSALKRALDLEPARRPASALHFAEILETIAGRHGPRPTTVDLGLFLRNLFRNEADLPEDDGFGMSGYPSPALQDNVDDDETIASRLVDPTATGHVPPPAPGGQERTRSQPPPMPPPSVPVPRLPNPALDINPVSQTAAVVDPAEGAIHRTEPSSDAIRPPSARPTDSYGLGLLVTGIFIGASLAIIGCILALTWV